MSEVEPVAGQQVREAMASYDTGAGTGANDIKQQSRKTLPGGRGGSITPYDSASAKAAAAKRWAAVSQAARLGIADAGAKIPDIDKRGSVPVVRYLVQQHTLNAADPSARGATQSFKQVMDLAYPKPEREVAAAVAAPIGGATLSLSPELARELLAVLRERGPRVVEHRPASE